MEPITLALLGTAGAAALWAMSRSKGGGAPPPPPPPAPRPMIPPPTVPSAPKPAPSGGSSTAPPLGGSIPVDLPRSDAAHIRAMEVLQDLKAKGRNYNRNLMKTFQLVARIQVDGIYGPQTAGALAYFTGERIPPHTGSGFKNYTPPPPGEKPPTR